MSESRPFGMSAVLACYNEEGSVRTFVLALVSALRAGGHPFEIVAVNDGSRDRTLDVLHALQDEIPEMSTVVDFHRNFGQVAALTCAVGHARNEALLFMDTDFQFDPA